MSSFEFLEDVIGVNEEGTFCHPYKHTVRGLKGKFSYSFETHNRDFIPATAQELIALIEGGRFDETGKIRMLPPDSTNTKNNGAMRVAFYKGQKPPFISTKQVVSRRESAAKYWWVNHKQTHLDEYASGIIWSPKTKKNGDSNEGYLNLTRVNVGDIVISFAEGVIKFIGVVTHSCVEAPIPKTHKKTANYWGESGWQVSIEWVPLTTWLCPKNFLERIVPLLPSKHSPIKKNGDGNLCYLSSISPELGKVILDLLADSDWEVLDAVTVLAVSNTMGLEKAQNRLPAEQLRKVTPEYIWEAVQILLQGSNADGYRSSVDYDLLVDGGVRLAPKQVFGLAATAALEMDIKPFHFTGGVGTVCFELLEVAGYKIVPKGQQVESVEIPTDIEDKEWAEGQVKLVYHLRRERSPGLSKAKKASFIKEHGRLFCEECGADPIEVYGDVGAACIEVHHEAIHVADMGDEHKTTLDQLRCLCANCHRIVHHMLKLRQLDSTVDSQNQGAPLSEAVAR